VGVIRTKKPIADFEMSLEWRHLSDGGNSGVFLWAPKAALDSIKPGQLPPGGIEVQVLDHGFTAQYEASSGKKADWFTTDGDVFPVGSSTMKPFPPTAPRGSRSFPKERHSLGTPAWNHYFIRAVKGEVRLWVNGHEVSGGSDCNPSSGYLCLESEGAPVEFRRMKIREIAAAGLPASEQGFVQLFDGTTLDGKDPCEPYVFRSPDGLELCCLMRENRRSGTSLVMFSRDEGKTWSKAVDAPWGLTGDRHHVLGLPDGRMVIVFRNAAPRPDKDVPQDKGGFIAWVGTYDDIRQGHPGQYRVSLLKTFKDGFYPGIHRLPDGTIVATTYTTAGKDDVGCSIISVRFTMAEIDALAARPAE
jgi:hypothetical protein